MDAMTLTTYPVNAAGWRETAGPGEEEEEAGDLGGLVSAGASIAGSQLGAYGGVVQGAGQLAGSLISRKPMSGRNLGGQLGKIAGGAIGTYLGGSELGGAASALGETIGGLAGGGIEQLTGNKGRPLSPAERKILEEGKRQTRAGNPAAMTDAFLAVYRPQTYMKLKRQGKLPSEVVAAAQKRTAQQDTPQPSATPQTPARPKTETRPAPSAPPAPQGTVPTTRTVHEPRPAASVPTPAESPKPPANGAYPPLLREWLGSLSGEQRSRIDAGIRAGKGTEAFREIQGELAAQQAIETELQRQREALESIAASSIPIASDEAAAAEDDGYSETAAPPAKRPQPARHIGILPLRQYQLEHLLLHVPPMRKLDKRFLALLAGRSAAVRDVAGIDPATRTYQAEPGETPAGIAKKLTGRAERAADLLAANPGHREGDPIWTVPPGWMHFATITETSPEDTGTTSRSYTIKTGDTPVGIATKSGAKEKRPLWWSELKAANPQIPTTSDGSNFKYFYAGHQLWIPEEWPPSAMFQADQPQQIPTPLPPLPIPPANTTLDAGVIAQCQSMLALWNLQKPGVCNPPDFGKNILDFSGTTTTRFTAALTSFQIWYNATSPSITPLRKDGVIDDPTYKALFSTTVASVQTPANPTPTPGTPTPQGTPPGMPIPGMTPPPGMPIPGMIPPGMTPPSGQLGIPGIHGGVPALGGPSPLPGMNASPLGTTPFGTTPFNTPQSNGSPFPPGYSPGNPVPWVPGAIFNEDGSISSKIPGVHVPGQPPNVVWGPDGSMITIPPGGQWPTPWPTTPAAKPEEKPAENQGGLGLGLLAAAAFLL